MSDFEKRLAESLAERAELATGVESLAQGARSRLRRRRRGIVMVSSVAVVAVAVGVPVALNAGGTGSAGDPSEDASVATTDGSPEPTDWVPSGWRVETWKDISLAVPAEWKYGNLSVWCLDEDGPKPVVERPGGVVPSIGCMGERGLGVRFLGSAAEAVEVELPAGYQREVKEVGGHAVELRLTDPDLFGQILSTVHQVTGTDANGCPVESSIPAFGKAEGMAPLREVGTPSQTSGEDPGFQGVSLCFYGVGLEGPNLVKSEELSVADSRAVNEALRTAPLGSGPDEGPDDCSDWPESNALSVRSGKGVLAWVHWEGCTGHGVDLGSETRSVTSDVMKWVLSPGYAGSGFIGSMPIPEPEDRRG